MNDTIQCQFCRSRMVPVSSIICPQCRDASADRDLMTRLRRDLQQFRFVVGTRLADSKRFPVALRAAARATGVEPIEGLARLSVLAHRTPVTDPLMALHLVIDALTGVGIGPHTTLASTEATTISGGYVVTVVEIRRLFDEEVAGASGVSKIVDL